MHSDEFSLLNCLEDLNEMFGKDAFSNPFQIAVVLSFEWPRGQGESAAGGCTFGIGHVSQLLG